MTQTRDETVVLSKGERAIPAELASVAGLKLRIWNTGFERFDELAGFPNLAELEIMDYRADSLAPLAGLRNLRRLFLAHFPGVRSLEPLGGLGNLEELTLETLPSWDASRKRQVVESFQPLAALQEQFALLSAKLTQVRSPFLAPFLRLEGNVCKRCGSEKVMLSGADVPNPKVVCPSCQRAKFETTVERFESIAPP